MDNNSILQFSKSHRPLLSDDKFNALSLELRKLLALGSPKPKKEWAAEHNISVKELDAIVKKGRYAERLMVESNLLLVQSFINNHPYYTDKLGPEEAFQEALIGLSKAVRTYNPQWNCRFSTYAWVILRNALSNANSRLINQNMYVGCVESSNSKWYREARKTKAHFAREFGRYPTNKELQELMGLSDADFRRLLKVFEAVRPVLSLYGPTAKSGEALLMDILPSKEQTPDEWLEIQDDHEQLRKNLQELTAEQQTIVTMYYGLDGMGEKTLMEVAGVLGKSKTNVITQLRKAIKQLKYQYRPTNFLAQ